MAKKSKAVKGIAIEFSADTTEFRKNLKSMENEVGHIHNELKHVDRLLKFDPTNTELLAQKQLLLNKNVEALNTNLAALKDAKAVADEDMRKGTEINQEEYRRLQREIIETEKKLGECKSEIGDNTDVIKKLGEEIKYSADEIESAKKKVSDYGEHIKNMGEKAKTAAVVSASALGAAAVTVGGYASKFSDEYQAAMNNFVTKTGFAEQSLQGFDEILSNLYKNNYGEDLNDIAEAMATVTQNTKRIDLSEIKSLTQNALVLRDTFEYDLGETMRAVNMLMDQFGVTGEEAFNLIAQGAQYGIDKNGDLLDSINEYSVHFKQLGLNAEEMFNSLMNGAFAGTFSVDKLGDAVKEFGIRTKDNSKSTNEAFLALGLNATNLTKKFNEGGESGKQAFFEVTNALFNMKNAVKQNEVGVALFGTMWEDLGVEGIKAITDIDGEFDKLSNSIVQITGEKYNDVGNALQGLKRSVEIDIIKPLGDSLLPIIENIIVTIKEKSPEIKTTLKDTISGVLGFCEWFLNNGELIVGIVESLGVGFAAFKVVTTIVKAIEVFNTLKTAITGVSVAQALLNTTMLANPLALIVAGIATLVTAFVILWNKCEAFRNFWGKSWENCKIVFFSAVNFVKENWKEMLLCLTNPVAGAFKLLYKLNPKFRAWVDGVTKTIRDGFSCVKKIGADIVTGLWNGIAEKAKWIQKKVTGFTDSLKKIFTGKDGFDTHSPSKWAEKIGKFLMEGLAEGINNDMSAEDALQKKIGNLKSFISNELGVSDSDIKLADAEYELWELQNPNATDKKKADRQIGLLMSKIKAQSSAVQIVNDALYESVQLTGENSTESKEYQLQLINERIELEKLEEEMRKVMEARKNLYQTSSDSAAPFKLTNFTNPVHYMRQNNTARKAGQKEGQTVNNVTQNYYGYKGTISENNAALKKTLRNAEVSLA